MNVIFAVKKSHRNVPVKVTQHLNGQYQKFATVHIVGNQMSRAALLVIGQHSVFNSVNKHIFGANYGFIK